MAEITKDQAIQMLEKLTEELSETDEFLVLVCTPNDGGVYLRRLAVAFPHRLFGEAASVITRDMMQELINKLHTDGGFAPLQIAEFLKPPTQQETEKPDETPDTTPE